MPRTFTVFTRKSRAEILREIRNLPHSAGRSQEFLRSLGNAVLGQISEQYKRKAKGGTDVNGLRWAELSPFTVKMRTKQAHLRYQRGRHVIPGIEILRDTDRLLTSLAPGQDAIGNADQVFRIGTGELTLGSAVPYAILQHEGVPPKLPARPLWSSPSNWTGGFWRPIVKAVAGAAATLIEKIFS